MLTLVCASALAAITDPKYKSNGTILKNLTMYNDEMISSMDIVKEPKCATGTARIITNKDKNGNNLVDHNGNPITHTYEVSVDPIHNVELKTLDGKEASCDENGIAKYVCKDCGAVDPYGQGEIALSKKDHSFTKVVIDAKPTCKNYTTGTDGKYHFECEYCGKPKTNTDGSIAYTIVPYATGDANCAAHSFTAGAYVTEKVQTCKEGGLRYLKCTVCGQPEKNSDGTIKYDAAYKNPAEHTFGDWVTVTPGSCVDGLKTRYCSVCNFAESAVIPGTGNHIYDYIILGASGCSKDGSGKANSAADDWSKMNVWMRCTGGGKEIKKGDMTAAQVTDFKNHIKTNYNHHNFVVDPNGSSKPAGCVNGANGYQDMICTACNGKHQQTIAKKTSHNFGQWKLVVSPGTDGTQNGVWERYCTNYGCIDKETYVGTTAPSGADPLPVPSTNPSDTPTTSPSTGTENYQVTSWSYSGGSVSGQVGGNVSYRTPGLSVNVIIYTSNGTFLATSVAVDENGHFAVSAGGAVYAVSIQLKDNNKVYQSEGKYV